VLPYVVWLVVSIQLRETPGEDTGVRFKIALALTFLVFEGMGAAFVLMAFPWYFSVRWYDRLQRFGLIYFPLNGAATALIIGSCTSSLSLKSLFIEDQTFLEGFMIAIERQGICLLLTGFVFGLTFWVVSERQRYSKVATKKPHDPNDFH